ncbi:MAG: S8 family serine peptidase [Streptosporangiaceae bacterium]|nr:S8 family serine peptidase [Streptosporangiaceae bacterium]
MRLPTVVFSGLLGMALAAAPAGRAVADAPLAAGRIAAGCQPPAGQPQLSGQPWAQQALDFSGVWDLTRGRHVTVAVVDSGVDQVPQLAGRVTAKDETGTGTQDCIGHGTAVASIIAAADRRADGIPFFGVAPSARILSVKVTSTESGSPGALAQGIIDAAEAGAEVINVSIQTSTSSDALRSAVEFAQAHDAVVVAAAGNDNPGGGVGPFYPASYPGVLSVGAVDQTGALASFTDTRTPVSVTAPGQNIASDWPGGFNPVNQGTSFAAPFVSGVAALIRSAYPQMTAAQVVRRIEATADGSTGEHTGAGLVNPVQAVTALLPAPAKAASQVVTVPRPSRADPLTRRLALSVTGGAIALAVVVTAAALVIPAGRRRRWRPGHRRPWSTS